MANYLNVPAASGATTPNQAGFAVGTTSLDLRIEMALTNWASGSLENMFNQYLSGGGSGSRFYFAVQFDGKLVYNFYNITPGSTNAVSTIAPTIANGASLGVRVLHNVAAGTVDFFTSPDFTVWTALGTQITGLVVTGQDTAGTAPVVRIGSDIDADNAPGKITKVQLLVNAASKFNWNITTATVGAGPWTSGSGEVWTALTTASVLVSGGHGGFLLTGVG